jgi:hypothetical protein
MQSVLRIPALLLVYAVADLFWAFLSLIEFQTFRSFLCFPAKCVVKWEIGGLKSLYFQVVKL